MNQLLLVIFVIVAIAMVVPAIWRKDYRLQFPCLAGLAVLYQIALPLKSLIYSGELPTELVMRFSVMAILCLLAAWAGYEWWLISKNRSQMHLAPESGQRSEDPLVMQFNSMRLAISATILFSLGAFFIFKLRGATPEIDPDTSGWTGIATIYSTLADVARYGAILAAILFMRTKDWRFLLLVLPQLWTYYQLFMIGRRSPTGEFAVIVCMLLWFYRKWAIPLWLMLLGVFGMAIFCFNINTVRNTIDEPFRYRLNAIMAAGPLHTMTAEGMVDDKKYVELLNGASYMEAKAIGGHYTYGLHFWNKLVFGFVPAQFVGKGVKDSLMIPLEDDTQYTAFQKDTGTCETGIAEAFMAFGYFGCGLFFVMGAFMGWLWQGASRGSILHQLLLMLCTVPAVMAFTLQLWTFLNQIVTFGIFAGPLLLWSRDDTGRQISGKGTKGTGLRDRKTGKVQSDQAVGPYSVTKPEALENLKSEY